MVTAIRLDRLLPRYSLREHRLQIGWNVQSVRLRRRLHETVEKAFLIDLSLGGALIEAQNSVKPAVGDVVTVRFGGVDGQAIIRHRREADRLAYFGIQWLESAELRPVIEKAVGMVRGGDGELRARWEDDRR